jgi:hypothetical protein
MLNAYNPEFYTNYIIFSLQEPWSPKNKSPPKHRDFTLFVPTTKNPKCATYIRNSALLEPYVYFQYNNFAIAVTIQPTNHQHITIYNVNSPGGSIHAANLIPTHTTKLPAIFMSDLNAHHKWWYGEAAIKLILLVNTLKEFLIGLKILTSLYTILLKYIHTSQTSTRI